MINRRSLLRLLGIAPVASAVAAAAGNASATDQPSLPVVGEANIVPGEVTSSRLPTRLTITNGATDLVLFSREPTWFEVDIAGVPDQLFVVGDVTIHRVFDDQTRFTVYAFDLHRDGGRSFRNVAYEFRPVGGHKAIREILALPNPLPSFSMSLT